jgi:hypothetical protein
MPAALQNRHVGGNLMPRQALTPGICQFLDVLSFDINGGRGFDEIIGAISASRLPDDRKRCGLG